MAQGESGGQPHVSRALGIDFRHGQEIDSQLRGERAGKGFLVGDEIGIEQGIDPSEAGGPCFGERARGGFVLGAAAMARGEQENFFDGPWVGHISGGWGRSCWARWREPVSSGPEWRACLRWARPWCGWWFRARGEFRG